MANLVLTRRCTLGCSFCFAGGRDAAPIASMSLADFNTWRRRLPNGELRLCGGEPTEHPRFIELCERTLDDEQRRIFVMSHGLWSTEVRDWLRSLAARRRRRLRFMINVLDPLFYNDEQIRQLDRSLRCLDPERTCLAITLDDPRGDDGQILALAQQHGIRHLRYSLAAPSLSQPASWRCAQVSWLRAMAPRVTSLWQRAAEAGLRLISDCAYLPPCLLDETQQGQLAKLHRRGLSLDFSCHGPVDVGPDDALWRCYGLEGVVQTRLAWHHDLDEAAIHLQDQLAALPLDPLFAACARCELQESLSCGGGCHALRRVLTLRRWARDRGVDLDDEASLLAARLCRPEQRVRLTRRESRELWLHRVRGEWYPLDLSPEAQRLLDAASPTSATLADMAARLDMGAAIATRLARELLVKHLLEFESVASPDPRVP